MEFSNIYEFILNKKLENNLKNKIEMNGIIYLLSIMGLIISINYDFYFASNGVECLTLIQDLQHELNLDFQYKHYGLDNFTKDKMEVIKQMIICSNFTTNNTAWIQTLASVHYLKNNKNYLSDNEIINILFKTNIMFQNEDMIKQAIKIMT